MKTILLVSPYWKEDHRWMVSSYKLAELWQRLGYKVVVVCMGGRNDVEKVSETLEVHRRDDIFLKDPWNYAISFGFSGYVCRLAKALQPDHILVNKILFWSSISVIWLRLRGFKVTLLTDALVGITWWPRGRLPQLFAAIYAWTLGWLIMLSANRFITFHPQPDRLLRRMGMLSKTSVIPTGIDAAHYRPADDRGQHGITVTYVGRLESVKGVDDFLAAIVPLKSDYPDLTVQVVGWYKPEHPLVEQYQREVRFTGLQTDIAGILGSSDIFVLPSYSEGLSNALMEAMSSSCACIATDVGGNAYLLQNGVSGFLYQPGDRDALAAHVRRLLDDPAKRAALQAAARARIDQVFSWDKVGKQYQALFAELAA